MKRVYKIIFLILLIILLIMICSTPYVYAKTEREELLELLDEYKDELGNLTELKEVVDAIYDDLYSATSVDEDLKARLNSHIEDLKNVSDINPLILNVLEIEIQSQINNLTDSNIDDMREEISVIKEWTDKQVGSIDNNEENKPDIDDNIYDAEETEKNNSVTTSTSNISESQNTSVINKLPFAGKLNISLIIIILIINIVFCIIKNKRLRGL